MKNIRMLMLGLAATLALTACAASSGSPGPSASDATTMGAAENAYTTAAHLETLWLQSGKATPAQAAVAKGLEGAAYADVVAGRTAVANNDSAAVTVALKLFNQALPAFQGYMASNGGTLGH